MPLCNCNLAYFCGAGAQIPVLHFFIIKLNCTRHNTVYKVSWTYDTNIMYIFMFVYFVSAQQNCTLCWVRCRLLYFEWVAVQPTGYFSTSHSQFCKLLASDQMSLLLLVRNYWQWIPSATLAFLDSMCTVLISPVQFANFWTIPYHNSNITPTLIQTLTQTLILS